MRPLFAIAPLALLLAFAGPRPVRWDQGEQAVRGIASEAAKTGNAASAPADPLAAHGGRDLGWRPGQSLGFGLRNVAAEAPSPHSLPR